MTIGDIRGLGGSAGAGGRVVAAFDVGDLTDEEVATLFQVGEATVHRWKRLKRETGSLVPRPPRGPADRIEIAVHR